MKAPIIHCHGSQADEAFERHAALQQGASALPRLGC